MAALKPAHVSSAAEALAALDPEQKLRVEELLLEQLQARKRDRRLQHFVATLAETVRQTVPTISRHVCVLLCVLLILMLGALGYHYSTVLAYPLVAWRSESGYPALDLTLKRYNFKQFNFRCPIFFPDVCKSDFLLKFQRADPCKPFDNCIQAHITCLQLKRHCVYNTTATAGWKLRATRPKEWKDLGEFNEGLRGQARYATGIVSPDICKNCRTVMDKTKKEMFWWGDRVMYESPECMECKYGSVEGAQLPVVSPPTVTVESLKQEFQDNTCRYGEGCALKIPEADLRYAEALQNGKWDDFHNWLVAHHKATDFDDARFMLLLGETKCGQLWGTERYPVDDCCVDLGQNKLTSQDVTTCSQNTINSQGACIYSTDPWICFVGLLCCETEYEGKVVVANAETLALHRKQAHSMLRKFGLKNVPFAIQEEEQAFDALGDHRYINETERSEHIARARGATAEEFAEHEEKIRKGIIVTPHTPSPPPYVGSAFMRRYGQTSINAFNRGQQRLKELKENPLSDEFKGATSLVHVTGR